MIASGYRYKVANWPEYDRALQQRGSLVHSRNDWGWRAEPRTTAGGQSW